MSKSTLETRIIQIQIKGREEIMRQARIKFVGGIAIFILLGIGQGIGANTFANLEYPDTGMGLLVKVDQEKDVKTVPKDKTADEETVDFTGEWEIQEEDKAYQALLDAQGNGPYNHQNGRIQTEKVLNGLWSGSWHQKGNDREGGFEVMLSEDGNSAKGTWWYSRVGTQKNIPPREWGGTYHLRRLSPQK